MKNEFDKTMCLDDFTRWISSLLESVMCDCYGYEDHEQMVGDVATHFYMKYDSVDEIKALDEGTFWAEVEQATV